MTAILTFAAVIGLATLFGWLVRRFTRRIHSQVWRVRLSVGAGVLALVIGLAVMLLTGSLVPTVDDSMFGNRTSITAEFVRDPSVLKIEDDSPEPPEIVRIEVAVPRVVGIEDEVVVDLILGDKRALLPSGTYSAVIESSGVVKLRTTTQCDSGSKIVAPDMSSSASCSERPKSAPPESHFRWFVQSAKPTESYLTVKWPDQIGKTMNGGNQWRARLKRDGQTIAKPAGGNLPRASSSRGGLQSNESHELLSGERLTYRTTDFEVDCASQQFTLPVRFATSLGVSGATYSNLSFLGAILSGLLGGGWLWQIIPLLNRRRSQ